MARRKLLRTPELLCTPELLGASELLAIELLRCAEGVRIGGVLCNYGHIFRVRRDSQNGDEQILVVD